MRNGGFLCSSGLEHGGISFPRTFEVRNPVLQCLQRKKVSLVSKGKKLRSELGCNPETATSGIWNGIMNMVKSFVDGFKKCNSVSESEGHSEEGNSEYVCGAQGPRFVFVNKRELLDELEASMAYLESAMKLKPMLLLKLVFVIVIIVLCTYFAVVSNLIEREHFCKGEKVEEMLSGAGGSNHSG